MTIALLAALILIAAGHLVVLDRRDKRGFDERQSEREVMDRLLQRIQAPEIAVAQAASLGPDLPAVSPFDDDEYHAAQREAFEELNRREAEMQRLAG